MSERSINSAAEEPEDCDPADYDPDDAPEFTAEMAARAQIAIGDKIIREADPPLGSRRGRPPKPESERKELVSLRLSRDVVDWLRSTGPGWQTRVEAVLRARMTADSGE
ncbi:MAG TPA: BrnA antitoxin family protein [Allosphingosinicella sp.]|jgi:uncharacterized protein (DUF4415 family)